MLWREFLSPYSQGDGALFDNSFLERWGDQNWDPDTEDRTAAAKLQVQMISRITTQQLGYLEGVEKTALKSVYDLFEHTRTICTLHYDARHFSILAWHVLNTHVRPFTAKWHPVSERGMLSALDMTDEFRAELEALQGLLRHFEVLLAHVHDGKPPPWILPRRTNVKGTEIFSAGVMRDGHGTASLIGEGRPFEEISFLIPLWPFSFRRSKASKVKITPSECSRERVVAVGILAIMRRAFVAVSKGVTIAK